MDKKDLIRRTQVERPFLERDISYEKPRTLEMERHGKSDEGRGIQRDQSTDIAHGNRGGGPLHNVAQTDSNGFMSAADKVKLDVVSAGGTFTLAAAATKVVNDANVTAASQVLLFPTNAAAATLMSGAKIIFVTSRSVGVSFTVSTADGTAAAGTETFAYRILL